MPELMEKKTCFVISPIGSEGSDIRRRADQVLRHIITPAASACGFEPIRADQISEPGMITSQVIQHIVDDPLVLADLTGANPNVFYELALRHAIRKPLVQIIEKGDKVPFDVAGMRTIQVDHKDLDSVQESKQEIQKQIDNVVHKKPEDIESPVSVSLELQALRNSENPEERSFAEFRLTMTEMRLEIASINERLSQPESLLPPSYLGEVLGHTLGRTQRAAAGDDALGMLARQVQRVLIALDKLPEGKEWPEETSFEIERLKEIWSHLARRLA